MHQVDGGACVVLGWCVRVMWWWEAEAALGLLLIVHEDGMDVGGGGGGGAGGFDYVQLLAAVVELVTVPEVACAVGGVHGVVGWAGVRCNWGGWVGVGWGGWSLVRWAVRWI